MHRCLLGQRNYFPGVVQSHVYFHSLSSLCFYLSVCCRAPASSCSQGCWRNGAKGTICTFASLRWEWSAPAGIDIPPEWIVAVGWCSASPLKGIFGCAMKDPAVISTLSNGLGSRTEMPWWNLPLVLTLAWQARPPHPQTFVSPVARTQSSASSPWLAVLSWAWLGGRAAVVFHDVYWLPS